VLLLQDGDIELADVTPAEQALADQSGM